MTRGQSRGKGLLRAIMTFGALGLSLWTGRASAGSLEQTFASPPAEAKPQTYWFWLCPTREGITRDLESLKDQGVGGFVHMNLGDSSVWADAPAFMGKEWHGMFQHALAESKRLGLEAVIHNCDGFQEAGGPWNTPENAMKELVWSRVTVTGGQPYRALLPRPPAKEGFYRDVAVLAYPAREEASGRMAEAAPTVQLSKRADQYMLWWQGNIENLPPESDQPGSAGHELMDGNPHTAVPLWADDDKTSVSVQFEFAKPYTCSALYYYPWRRWNTAARSGEVQASDDGKTFRKLCAFEVKNPDNPAPLMVTFPETTAKAFRILLLGQTQTVVVAELELLGSGDRPSWNPRIPWLEAKSGGARLSDGVLDGPPVSVPEQDALKLSEVQDLTALADHLGRLEWTPPAGRWTILRLGYTLTGAENHPASSAGIGWECDKMDKGALMAHLDGWVGKMVAEQRPLVGKNKTWKTVHADSWECGQQNWTPAFAEEFARRRGYSLRPYLPVLAGEVLTNSEVSERFLHDFRRTIADLVAENYFGAFQEWCHAQGMQFQAEALGPDPSHQPPVDHLQCKGRTDIPMGEFHEFRERGDIMPRPGEDLCRDIREAASAAHVYGRPLAAAEAFTAYGNWPQDPYWLKDLGDLAFCSGINRLILHCTFQQPDGRRPGWVYPPMWGINFHRNNTWWGQAHGWLDYLTRCQALLQQGRFVGDVLLYTGENAPAFGPAEGENPAAVARLLPAELRGAPEWEFDWCNAEVLLKRVSVREGRLVLPEGQSYRVLVLPEQGTMSLEVLAKLHALVAAGATVVGPRPERIPGLTGYPQSDKALRAQAGELWGDCDGQTVKEHALGKGRVIWGKPLGEVMKGLGVTRDFEYLSARPEANLRFIHRTTGEAEVYFVSNQRARDEEVECFFRVSGRAPELWHPETGRTEYPAIYREEEGRTVLPLRLAPKESVFVIFRERARHAPASVVLRNGEPVWPRAQGEPGAWPVVEATALKRGLEWRSGAALLAWEPGVYELKRSDGKSVRAEVPVVPPTLEFGGDWEVRFPPNQGAPQQVIFKQLASWSESAEEGIKYFSGTATYVKDFELPTDLLGKNLRLFLDLGRVKNLAEVKLNGQDLGLLWKPPFRLEIGRVAKPGRNRLEVRVTNMWVNRLIGDERLPEAQRYTWTNIRSFYKADSPLLESGLLGPVVIRSAVEREARL